MAFGASYNPCRTTAPVASSAKSRPRRQSSLPRPHRTKSERPSVLTGDASPPERDRLRAAADHANAPINNISPSQVQISAGSDSRPAPNQVKRISSPPGPGKTAMPPKPSISAAAEDRPTWPQGNAPRHANDRRIPASLPETWRRVFLEVIPKTASKAKARDFFVPARSGSDVEPTRAIRRVSATMPGGEKDPLAARIEVWGRLLVLGAGDVQRGPPGRPGSRSDRCGCTAFSRCRHLAPGPIPRQ